MIHDLHRQRFSHHLGFTVLQTLVAEIPPLLLHDCEFEIIVQDFQLLVSTILPRPEIALISQLFQFWEEDSSLRLVAEMLRNSPSSTSSGSIFSISATFSVTLTEDKIA